MHWATRYIGADYDRIGRCWGLVRHLCAERFGDAMPPVAVGTDVDQASAIKHAASVAGWRRVHVQVPEPDDIVVMDGPEGRHVAWAIVCDGDLAVLHARGPILGVEVHGWRELPDIGFRNFEFWRRAR